MRMFGALRAYDDLPKGGASIDGSKVLFVTVTAPGVDGGLVWDPSACQVRGPHRHSGELGCRVLPAAAAVFNKWAPSWWSDLNAKASRNVERAFARPSPAGLPSRRASAPAPAEKGADAQPGRCPRSEIRQLTLARVFELQKRGVLHIHLALGYSTISERARADLYVRELRRLAPASGFGLVDPNPPVIEATAAAGYLSAYFVSGKHGKMSLTESVTRREMPRSIIYVRPELLQHSGLSMRTLRLRRFLWWHIDHGILRHLAAFGLDLESAYVVVKEGFWGKAFLNGCAEAMAP